MKNKKIIIFSFLIILTFGIIIFNYSNQLTALFAEGITPNPGHTWSEIQCTSDFCVKSGTGVGIGTEDLGTNKLKVVGATETTGNAKITGNLDVIGSVNVTTNVCISGGACLSDIESFTDSQPIVGGTEHNRGQCTDTNSVDGVTKGELIDIGLANPVCRFAGAACPSGWTQYFQWATYARKTCTYGTCSLLASWSGCNPGRGIPQETPCTVGTDNFLNTAQPTCSYGCTCYLCNGYGTPSYKSMGTCIADRIQIGCY